MTISHIRNRNNISHKKQGASNYLLETHSDKKMAHSISGWWPLNYIQIVFSGKMSIQNTKFLSQITRAYNVQQAMVAPETHKVGF